MSSLDHCHCGAEIPTGSPGYEDCEPILGIVGYLCGSCRERRHWEKDRLEPNERAYQTIVDLVRAVLKYTPDSFSQLDADGEPLETYLYEALPLDPSMLRDSDDPDEADIWDHPGWVYLRTLICTQARLITQLLLINRGDDPVAASEALSMLMAQMGLPFDIPTREDVERGQVSYAGECALWQSVYNTMGPLEHEARTWSERYPNNAEMAAAAENYRLDREQAEERLNQLRMISPAQWEEIRYRGDKDEKGE